MSVQIFSGHERPTFGKAFRVRIWITERRKETAVMRRIALPIRPFRTFYFLLLSATNDTTSFTRPSAFGASLCTLGKWRTAVQASASTVVWRGSGGWLLAGPLTQTPGKIIVIWDGAPIHRGHENKEFLKRGAARRLHLEYLPGSAPDLNPDEGIWNYLKRVELGNVCCSDLAQLNRELIRARERLRHKQEIIKSCSHQCGYSI